MFAIALVAGVMWSCGGDRVTQSQVAEEQVGRPLSKLAVAGHSLVVVARVHEAETPVSGVMVEFSRSVAGQSASYDWSGMTDDAGQAQVTITGGSGYYQARAVQDGSEIDSWSSIPLNAGDEVLVDLPIGGRAQLLSSPPVVAEDKDALTMAYVQRAIERYEREGLEATIAYYNSLESIEGERAMLILSEGDQTVVSSPLFPQLIGSNAYTGPGTAQGIFFSQATPEGYWYQGTAFNPVTQQQEPARVLVVLYDGLIFLSGHFIVREDLAGFTMAYVQRAMDYYDANGLDATVAYYDSQESVEGQFYLFLIGADDIYLAHPIFPHLKGTDIKDVKGSDGQELGKEIAEATEAGHWVDYLWPHPVTRIEEPKSAWVVRHDGLIFASGYYTPDPNAEPPAWRDAEPREYTITYVDNAIERYKTYGLQGLRDYYNSVASHEGQWYLFATDANDIYIVHGLLSHLIGTDIKDVQSSDNPNLGEDIAAATEEGIWVEYLWPHPVTLQDAPKVAYAKRYDGLIFASGYYPGVADPAAHTQAYVAAAIEMYDREGADATWAYYNSPASIDEDRFLLVVDENNLLLTAVILPALIGQDYSVVFAQAAGLGPDEVSQLETATAEGNWFSIPYHNPLTAEDDVMHIWAVRHDGLLFAAMYATSE